MLYVCMYICSTAGLLFYGLRVSCAKERVRVVSGIFSVAILSLFSTVLAV